MERKNVALFTCTNGYGHIKRLLLLSEALSASGANPVLFAPISTAELIAKTEGITTFEIVDFNTQTNKENWFDGSATKWIKFAPNLSEFDIVISDNLIEILLIRPDAWLSGSFFWHDALNHFPEYLKKKSLALLKKYRPKMISSELFTSDQLKINTELYEVGLYASNFLDSSSVIKTDALIACGVGGSVKKEALEFVANLAKKGTTKFNQVWVEPEILPSNYPDWMTPASFTREMYQKILVAIIRPGVGSITSSLSTGSRIFPFYEYENLEMSFNASKLYSSGVADATSLISEAWHQAELYRIDNDLQKTHLKKLKNFDFEGASQAAKIILSEL
jgi:hypothetical protein